MSARLRASLSSASPQIAADPFLRTAIKVADRLCSESELRGYALLSTLFEIARAEAEDNLRTYGKRKLGTGQAKLSDHEVDDNEGAREIAAKFVRGADKQRTARTGSLGGEKNAKAGSRSTAFGRAIWQKR